MNMGNDGYIGTQPHAVTGVDNTDYLKASASRQITYNASGSLVSDAGRGIARIDYDQLNNPVRIQFIKGSVTKYIYSTAGEKLRVIHQTAVPNITVPIGSVRELIPSEILSADTTDYLLGGSLTMKNGRIDKLQFDEGYCQATKYVRKPSQDNFTFYYYNRDHLGSIRQVTKADGSQGSIVQSLDYYPFGAQFCHSSTASEVQSRKYNGKEFDNMHGLSTYDYGARQYNPVTARWDRVDPLCEKYYGVSPYAYCANNPVRYIDPDGRYILSEEQAKKYPRLNQYLQKGIQGILDNPKIMHALRVAGRFNDEQIKEMVTYGKGPIINVEDLHGSFGKFNRGVNSKMLRISEKWVNKLENSKGFDSDVYLFLIAVTILHESSHYGDNLAGEPDGEDREDGDIFEKMAYGEIIDEDNAKKHVKEYFDKSPHNNSQIKKNDE